MPATRARSTRSLTSTVAPAVGRAPRIFSTVREEARSGIPFSRTWSSRIPTEKSRRAIATWSARRRRAVRDGVDRGKRENDGVRSRLEDASAKRSMNRVESLPRMKSASSRMRRCIGIVVLIPSITKRSRARRPREMASSRSRPETMSLRDQRVVVGRDHVALVGGRVDAHAEASRGCETS